MLRRNNKNYRQDTQSDKGTSKLKVLEITGEPIIHGGQEIFILNLIENIGDDYSVDVLTPYYIDNKKFENTIEARNDKVIALGQKFEPGKSRLPIVPPIFSYLRGNKYDVVHIHSGSISVLAYVSMCARLCGISKIIVHSHSKGYDSLKHKVIKTAMTPFMLIGPTDYCACSQEAGEWKFPMAAVKKLKVIQNGIDLERYRFNEEARKRIRNQYEIDDTTFVIGHVGRFSQEKNHRFLIEVFKKYSEINPDTKLLLVGDGELKPEIEEQVKAESLQDRVVMTGNVDNPEDYYSAMDVFCLPSIHEGAPLVIIEAQASGLRTIISTGVAESLKLSQQSIRLPLMENEWVNSINNIKKQQSSDRRIVTNKGYSIEEMWKKIRGIYLG